MCSALTSAPTLCGLRHPPRTPAEAQRLPYYATYCPTRLLIHSMCTSHYLDIFITFIICLNVVTMSLEHYNQPTVSPAWPLGPQWDPTPGMGGPGSEQVLRRVLCLRSSGPGRMDE